MAMGSMVYFIEGKCPSRPFYSWGTCHWRKWSVKVVRFYIFYECTNVLMEQFLQEKVQYKRHFLTEETSTIFLSWCKWFGSKWLTIAVVVRLIPAWQLKTIGVEAEVFLSKPVIWSKHSSWGALSWFTGIRRAWTLST